MKRRVFLKASMSGVLPVSAVCAFQGAAPAAEGHAASVKIDTEGLVKAARQHFMEGKKACSESILLAGCQALGIRSELVPDVALGLAGGIGLQGKTCGVVCASAMVLSLAVAPKEADYGKRKKRLLPAVGAVVKRFEDQFGSTECRKLSGLDLTTPEGRKALEESVKAEKCLGYLEACAKMLAEAVAKV
jgi:C_GCAxxG_C_C family probable redox protein